MNPPFQVIVNSFVQSPGEWKRVFEADAAGRVSQLSEDERLVAKKLGMGEKEVADKIKAGQYGELRLTANGLGLGEQAASILKVLGPDYKLLAVLWESSRERWVLRIETAESKIVSVAVPMELADDVLDSGALQDIDRLKNLVLFGVGRQELIFKH
jgi:hypothetical protein